MSATIPSPTQGPADTVKCDRYYTLKNQTYFIYGGYEGIPENLLINVIVCFLLLLLFSLLRKIAWDYGRLALVNRTEARTLLQPNSPYNVWTSLFYGDNNSDVMGSQESLDTHMHRQDKGFCSWIGAFFRLKDDTILAKCGYDALQYLQFQRYLLIYMLIITILSIAVILPCNFQGDLEGNTQAFGHTTISNIEANSPILWVHSVFAVLYLALALVLMRHFSVNLRYEEDENASRTLMISNIPKNKCFKNTIMQHFQEAYPESQVEDIQFAYNIRKLSKLNKKKELADEGFVNSEAIYKQLGSRPTMAPYCCGQCCCCNNVCCKQVDAIDYYREEAAMYKAKCDEEKVVAFRNTLGIAFVTFEDSHVARRVHDDFKVSCKGAHNPVPSSVSRELSVHNWECKYPPSASNIYWENLSVSPAFWWLKAIIINFFMFVLLFFFSTPSVFLNLLNQGKFNIQELHNPLLVQFLPTLLLWAVATLLPLLVYYTDLYLGHWTRTAMHQTVMRKTFIFLIVMVLILPSLGLTSAKAFFEWAAVRNEEQYKFRWECIFVPDNGAFFVNYVITSAFIGCAADLARLTELFSYAMKLMCARSAAEKTSVRKTVQWEFQFGMQYAYMLCVFAVIMAFSIPCPLITPFGLVYLLNKHLVDRYNIYFAYGPSKINRNIHASAVNFVMIAVMLLQFMIVFFTILRANALQGITIFSVVALFVTLIIFTGRVCFGWFKGLSPIKYKPAEGDAENLDTTGEMADSKPFIPTVLLPADANYTADGNQQASYGATENNMAENGGNNGGGGLVNMAADEHYSDGARGSTEP